MAAAAHPQQTLTHHTPSIFSFRFHMQISTQILSASERNFITTLSHYHHKVSDNLARRQRQTRSNHTKAPRQSMDVLTYQTNSLVEIPAILAVVLSFSVGCFAGELLEPTRPP